jgi:hypothetical protein
MASGRQRDLGAAMGRDNKNGFRLGPDSAASASHPDDRSEARAVATGGAPINRVAENTADRHRDRVAWPTRWQCREPTTSSGNPGIYLTQLARLGGYNPGRRSATRDHLHLGAVSQDSPTSNWAQRSARPVLLVIESCAVGMLCISPFTIRVLAGVRRFRICNALSNF